MSTDFISSAGLSPAKEPHLLSQKKLSRVLTTIAEALTLAAMVLVPLAFLVNSSQSIEFPKQITLLVLVSLAALCWTGSMLVNKSLAIRRTVANPVVLVLLVVVLLSALLNVGRYVSMVGGNGQEYQSFITTILFAAFFFVVVNLPKEKFFVMRAIMTAIIIGGLVSLLAIFQFAGVHLIPWVSATTFNLIGSTVVLGLYAAVTVVLAAASFLMEAPSGKACLPKRIVAGVFGAAAMLLCMIINFWPVWVAIIVGLLVILIFAIVRPHAIRRLNWLAVPMIALVMAVLFLVVNVPMPIHAPTEVFPSLTQSLGVAKDTLVSHAIFGTGPGSFAQDFALYRTTDLNQSPLWYVQFDRGMSFLTTIAATMGLGGLVAWLAVIVIGLWKSAAYLIASRKNDENEWVLVLLVAAAWFASAAGLVLYGGSLASLLLFWLLFALLIRTTSSENVQVSFESSPRSGLVLTFAFVILIVLALAGWFVSATRLYADAAFTKAAALSTDTKIDAVISGLENASRLDPQSDSLMRNLSQAYLLKVQQIFADSKMDASTRAGQVQNFTALAVKAATAATQLAPNDAQNWEQLGAVYEAIVPYVSNASDEAVTAYQHAADLDPTSPVHPTSLGRVYLAVAGMSLNDVKNAKDDASKATAQKKVDDTLVSAVTSLTKALKLKSDYAPASYQIALAYDGQNKIKEAINSLQDVMLQNPKDLGVGFEMASLYYRNGDKDKAKGELQVLIKESPNFANARWLLATIDEENKDYDDAIAQVQEILKNNADNKDVQAKLQALQNEKAGIAPTAPGTPAAPPVLGGKAAAPTK